MSAVGLLLGGLVLGAGILMGGSGKKKKKPATNQIADALAEAEEAGEVVVTDEGDVIEVEPDPEADAIAADLQAAEERGDVAVTDDGGIAEKVDATTWNLRGPWFARLKARPVGISMDDLLNNVLNHDVVVMSRKKGVLDFLSFDDDDFQIVQGEELEHIPIVVDELDLLSWDEFKRLARKKPGGKAVIDSLVDEMEKDPRVTRESPVEEIAEEIADAEARGEVAVSDDGEIVHLGKDAVADAEANELAEAEARGEIEVSEDGDVVESEEAVAADLADAEARGEIEVSEDGDVVESEEAVAADLAEAEARGEIEVSEDGEVTSLTVNADAQELAELLVAAEREKGSLWKAAHEADIQTWQLMQRTDYQGRPLKPDGWFGPTGAKTLANLGVSVIPLVRRWPKGSTQQTAVTEYKIELQQLPGADPQAVRVALLRERGQGYGTARAIPPAEQAG